MIKIDISKSSIAFVEGNIPTLLTEITSVIVVIAKKRKVNPLKYLDSIKKTIINNPTIIDYLIEEVSDD